MKKALKKYRLLIPLLLIAIAISVYEKLDTEEVVPIPEPVIVTVPYTGKIYHIFFHSLIVYPELAFDGTPHAQGYQDYMITRDEFYKILPRLYSDGFILIDPNILISTTTAGISRNTLSLPEGKRPLILSLDDLNYYRDQDYHGFANKLVLDKRGKVATEITTPLGKTEVTRDGDIVPILDDFIDLHPDFSWKGARGVIAVTGHEGVFGYRTNKVNSGTYTNDVKSVKDIVKRLKETGWTFASHSYSHQLPFRDNSITLDMVKWDTEKWDKEVRPLVGDTNLFIGPFGQVFSAYDERRNYLVSKGFNMLFGVGMDLYQEYFPNYFVMNRADIDGIRLLQTPWHLKEYFNVEEVVDPKRFSK